MMQVLVCEAFQPTDLARLRAGIGAQITECAARKPLAEDWARAQILLIRSKTIVDADTLKKAGQLKLIVTATSGFDHIDFKATQERGIKVAFTPAANAQSTAELTLGLIIDCYRRIVANHQAIHDGHWKDNFLPGHELQGKTLGLIGCGRVAKKVARMAAGFEMKVIGHDPYLKAEEMQPFGIQPQGLTELLKQSDVISLHVPLTKETLNYINESTLSEMQSGAVLINTCRGRVIDENALANALDEGGLAAFGADVFANEPLKSDSRLKNRSNVVLSPHVGAYTIEALKLASKLAVDTAIEFVKSGKIADALPPEAPWARLL